MPKLPISYESAVVYKICCKDINITNIYVGSTTNLRMRKTKHKSSCNVETGKPYNLYVYIFIRENGGWDNWDIIEIEKCIDCNSANELRARERFYLELLKADLNKNIPNRTNKEYRVINKERLKDYDTNYKKQYNVDNKEKIKERRDEYYSDKKEEILVHKQQYYSDNLVEISAYKKEYREKNRELLRENARLYREKNKEQLKEKRKLNREKLKNI